MSVPRDEHELTLTFAEIALGQIRALAQPATPRNFEIWYYYATGYKPGLNQLINDTLAKKATLTEAELSDIYDAYISSNRIAGQIDAVNVRVLEEVKEVAATIDAAAGSANTYSKRLASASENLARTNDGEGLRIVVEHLVQGTKEMEINNKKLEARLSASAQEIEQLQQNLEAMRNESFTDPLTTLSNRKFFDQSLVKAIAEGKEKNEPLALLMTDIDHFKNFNDKFGHVTGDQVLRLVALSVKQNVKGRDVASRYGGEEFGVVLPNTTLESATTVAEQNSAGRHGQGVDEEIKRRTARTRHHLDRRRRFAA